MSNYTMLFRSMRILLMGIFFIPFLYASSNSLDYCSASTTYHDEEIIAFAFGSDFINKDDNWSSTIADYTHLVITAKMGEVYELVVYNGDAWSSDKSRVWIDYNQDGKFDTSSEEIILSSSDGGSTFTGKVTIPMNATAGYTRLRVRLTYSSDPTPCDNQNYGEVEDYTIYLIPPVPDAQIKGLKSPVKPFLVGNYPVITSLYSNNDTKLTSCLIDWYVNGVFQRTVSWTGGLSNGNSVDINVGNYNFVYPSDETKFDPFRIMFTVRNANGKDADADPSNDTYVINISPNLNDCGAIGFFGPAEGFGAGVTPVRARIMNFAPKPLSTVKVNWKIDGKVQTAKTFTGLNIKQNQYQDLDMGTYDFYNKTPLGPFEVEVWTELPNNIKDEDQSNDTYKGGIGPSLSAGTYYAGGSNAHFSSPAEAASYINSSGVFGPGTVTINIRSGVYTGQIILNNKLANDNLLIFRSETGKAYDVTLSYNPSTAVNYVVQLANMKNVGFENITIKNNNSNISNAGRLVLADNVDGLNFKNVVFNGINLAPKTAAYNIFTANNCTNINLLNNEFNNGSAALWSNSISAVSANITKNTFYNFSWYGVYNFIANQANKTDDFVVKENTFKRLNTVNPSGAVYSFNASKIINNSMLDIVGTGNANEAVIKVEHSSPDVNNTVLIESNNINNCSNINGIMVNNANTLVNKNVLVMSQSANYGCSLLDFSNSTGAVGNNILMGSNIMGFDVNNSPGLFIIYNTSSVELNGNPLSRFTGASANFKRNIIVNQGNGLVLQAASANNIDQNIIFTLGNILANINGKNYITMSDIQRDGFMLQSSAFQAEFFSPSDPHLKVYNGALVFNEPLFNNDNKDGSYIERFDYDGEPRISYFAGIDEINLTIGIDRQTDGFIDCAGATDNFLTVSAAIGYNAPMTYQWEHDGVALKGETEPILYFPNLRHSQAGVYRCLIKGPGKTEPIYSREVAVYVARPTEITKQPESMKSAIGGQAFLTFSAHVNGKNIETAIANDEVRVQWYKAVDEANDIPLVDNNFISGSKSNYLSFTNFRNSDKGEYYAIIDGLCGTVRSKNAFVSEEVIDLVVVTPPNEQELCEGADANFNVEATTQSAKQIVYQWSKDGIELNDIDGKITGAKTNNLLIANIEANDNGVYSVEVKLSGTGLVENLDANLQVNELPIIIIHPEDMIAEISEPIDLFFKVKNAKECKWYKDGELFFTTEVTTEFIVFSLMITDESFNGEYYVVVSNDCGEVQSETFTITVSVGTTSVIEVSKNGYSLLSATPNPATGISMIGFSVPTQSYIKLSLTDLSGASRTVLAEGTYEIGTHSINIDVNKLNLSSGTYFYYLEANGVVLSQKLVVIK